MLNGKPAGYDVDLLNKLAAKLGVKLQIDNLDFNGLIPGLLAALIGFHLYLVAKLGTTAPPWTKAEPSSELRKSGV